MEELVFLHLLEDRIAQLRQLTDDRATGGEAIKQRIKSISDELEEKVAQYADESIDFRRICDHLHVTLFVAGTDGKVKYVNPAYLNRTGLREEELVGRTMEELRNENVIQCDVIPTVLREGRASNAIGYVVPTDYRGFITGIPVRDADGEICYVITTDWDVSSIVEMENQLRQLKQGKTISQEDSLQEIHSPDDEILYVSSQMRTLVSLARTVAQTDVTVLITGETGTGKEVLSSAIVRYSRRSEQPFIKVNCAAIPQELLESELFGYEEGAFTGARRGGKKGAFEQADGGTILLDEIGELPFQVQAKLLRALQESEITRIGGQKPIHLDLRVIAATNRDLICEMKAGRFREDLYYRLNIMPLEIPPLRERTEDIPFLANCFLEEFDQKYQKTTYFESGVLDIFRNYEWPGNVRELKNLIERLVILCADGTVTRTEVSRMLKINLQENHTSEKLTLKQAVGRLEKMMIQNAIGECGSKNKAAEMLGVDHSTLIRKCQRYGIV